MNFDYSDDQKALKEEARKFLKARCPIASPRGVLEDEEIAFDRPLWRAIIEMGWAGAAIPERWGGSGLSYIELCAIAEELGRALAPIPFASSVYEFAPTVLAHGSDLQCEALLPGVASGEIVGCLAASERSGPFNFSTIGAHVTRGALTGVKTPVTDGDVATHAIVAARDEAGPGLFIVDLSSRGVSRTPLKTLDPTRSAARLRFEEVPCEPIGRAGEGASLLAAAMDRAAILIAFEQAGGADRCLEMARDYAMQRFAFGRPIGAYQAIKHKLAEVYVKNEIARSNAYYGAWALNAGAPELPRAAAAARVAATQAYDFAAKESLHTHGGVGFTWEMDCHLHLRRSRQLGLAVGGLPLWRERLVRALERRNAA